MGIYRLVLINTIFPKFQGEGREGKGEGDDMGEGRGAKGKEGVVYVRFGRVLFPSFYGFDVGVSAEGGEALGFEGEELGAYLWGGFSEGWGGV